jgi:hypothetical protein
MGGATGAAKGVAIGGAMGGTAVPRGRATGVATGNKEMSGTTVPQRVLPRVTRERSCHCWVDDRWRKPAKPLRLAPPPPPNRVLVRPPHFGGSHKKRLVLLSQDAVIHQDFSHHAEVCNLVGMEQNLALRERNAANKLGQAICPAQSKKKVTYKCHEVLVERSFGEGKAL